MFVAARKSGQISQQQCMRTVTRSFASKNEETFNPVMNVVAHSIYKGQTALATRTKNNMYLTPDDIAVKFYRKST